jgi:hypothetical protein
MTFKSRIWYPIAGVLSVINLVAVGFAAGQAEPWHAAVHAGLALAFGVGAERLRQRRARSELETPLDVREALEGFEAEMSQLRQDLSEQQERLDFAERLLAQRPETGRLGPER